MLSFKESINIQVLVGVPSVALHMPEVGLQQYQVQMILQKPLTPLMKQLIYNTNKFRMSVYAEDYNK